MKGQTPCVQFWWEAAFILTRNPSWSKSWINQSHSDLQNAIQTLSAMNYIKPTANAINGARDLWRTTHHNLSELKSALASMQSTVFGISGLYWWVAWWCHQMETFSALLALCAGNSPVTGKQSWRRGFETPSCSLWRHCNVYWWINF